MSDVAASANAPEHPAVDDVPLLRIQGLTKVYSGDKRALDALDLVIDRPEVIAVIGSSGAGKSTLIRCINRLVEPTSAAFSCAARNWSG